LVDRYVSNLSSVIHKICALYQEQRAHWKKTAILHSALTFRMIDQLKVSLLIGQFSILIFSIINANFPCILIPWMSDLTFSKRECFTYSGDSHWKFKILQRNVSKFSIRFRMILWLNGSGFKASLVQILTIFGPKPYNLEHT
jgi:hypothetical protein